MAKTTLKEILDKVVKASPAGIPYAGSVYAQALANKGTDDLKALLNEIKTLSQREIVGLNTTNSELQKIQETLNDLISSKRTKDKLTVVVPAVGEGGSLFPLTQVMPKCLVTIGNKSMIQHIIDPFYHHTDLFDKVVVMTGKYSEAIEENVKQGGYGDFVVCKNISGKTIPDTLLKLKDHLPKEPFLIHFDDVLIEDCDWNHIHSRYFEYKERRKHIGMLLCSKYYPFPLGIGVINEGETDILENFAEKPEQLVGGNLANLAIAIFEPEFFDYLEADHKGLFEDTIGAIISAKRTISLYRIEKWHHVQDLKALYDLQNHVDLGFLTRRCT
ncbi:sugar phosphate nucleotidyltransferase [Candidatus Neomarinimicrobiota bacterium]